MIVVPVYINELLYPEINKIVIDKLSVRPSTS